MVYFTNTHRLPIVHEQAAAYLADRGDVESLFRFHSTDGALECCEDALLQGIQASLDTLHRNLHDYEITAGFAQEELAQFSKLLTYRTHASGDRLITDGEEATNLLLITKGIVGVWVGKAQEEGSRVASFSVGTMVGEMAFIDRAKRSADVIAEEEVECAVLEIEDFLRLQDTHPVLHAKILRNIGVSLAMKLRKANQDMNMLAGVRD
jgi:glutaminase